MLFSCSATLAVLPASMKANIFLMLSCMPLVFLLPNWLRCLNSTFGTIWLASAGAVNAVGVAAGAAAAGAAAAVEAGAAVAAA